MKFSPAPTICRVYPDVQRVTLKLGARILTGEKGIVGCGLRSGGGHSGFQAINLAIQFGARRILLVGFDMTLANGAHWNHELSVAKPDAGRTESWRREMDECAPQFRDIGVDVVNCTMRSALTAYPKMELAEASL